ncbi:MAG: DUF4906 domain-containing protein [Bacteroidales bacterium]|nr:DUF4906 domain-containing protein [Bacteroidales bacterium]
MRLILSTITTLLILPALFSCTEVIDSPADEGNGTEVMTKVSLETPEDYAVRGAVDIFTFNNGGVRHLDSYQHMDSFSGQSIDVRSQSGEKTLFICTNAQRATYDWTSVNSMEALDKAYLELQKEKREALCATATGEITAGSAGSNRFELRRMASEIVLQSIRCDFSGSCHEGERITDVCVYLTNVNSRCPVTADGEILPGEIINSGKLDMDDVAGFKEPDMVYQKLEKDISGERMNVGMSFICYPNTSLQEGPGTPFTRLVIEGKINGETYWWPIDINRSGGRDVPGISRNSRYVFDITISRKGMKDPDTAISADMAQVLMSVLPWKETDDKRVMFQNTRIILKTPGSGTKAVLTEEGKVNDMNILAFADGVLEKSLWESRIQGDGDLDFDISLVKGRTYTIAAFANLGKRLKPKDHAELEKTIVEMPEEDGFRNGLPMSAMIEDITPDDDGSMTMELVRMTAKISIRMDRSRLAKDVRLTVRNVRIGNCPKYVSVIGPSKAESYHDVFERGFELTPDQCRSLNVSGHAGLSDYVSVYMFENMQGEDITVDASSFIEMEMDYLSTELISYDSPLIYRFYIEDEEGGYDIERNSHYHFTVTPEGDGLSASGWSIDKSGIGPVIPVFEIMPGDLVEGHVGDTVRVWCECYPRTAPFDPGYEELAYDKSRGIYDYKVDDDGHGVTLYLKKPGAGIVYMSAGEPINRSGMVLINVLP